MKRRTIIAGILCSAAFPLRAAEGRFEVTRTKAEWRAMLTDLEYAVLREEATETAFSSPLDKESREATARADRGACLYRGPATW